MKYIYFTKKINKNSLKNCYIIQGEDPYFRRAAREKIKSISGLQNLELNYEVFSENEEDKFFINANSYPMLSDFRILILNVSELSNSLLKKIKKYATNPNPTSILIIINSGKEIKSIENIENIEIIDCRKESMSVLTKWITITAKRADLMISLELSSEIAINSDMNMQNISNSVEKLISYCSGNSEITADAVELLVPKNLSASVFDLVSAIVEKNIDKALDFYEKMKLLKAKDTQILALLYRNYQRMFFSKMKKNTSDADLAKILKVKPYAITISRKIAKNYSLGKLRNCMDIIIKEETKIKLGQKSSSEDLKSTLLKLMQG